MVSLFFAFSKSYRVEVVYEWIIGYEFKMH